MHCRQIKRYIGIIFRALPSGWGEGGGGEIGAGGGGGVAVASLRFSDLYF